jgi:hypothetical protein
MKVTLSARNMSRVDGNKPGATERNMEHDKEIP